ncbi:hypothetical protein AGR1C_pAt20276 [Agrobacterium fabacearum TT111]|nr:hypothetical protein AGR1C_pAt20276 [Agrobacterium fabacearum TT111]
MKAVLLSCPEICMTYSVFKGLTSYLHSFRPAERPV